ncbi:hypothetical protein AB0M43_24080 [Longispora sp. NPDC051575]|uniref:hypothetical protein n=1 Tax=Longispora sp. NPDC051575 TaxID=3154943 RepID=UPI00341F3F17
MGAGSVRIHNATDPGQDAVTPRAARLEPQVEAYLVLGSPELPHSDQPTATGPVILAHLGAQRGTAPQATVVHRWSQSTTPPLGGHLAGHLAVRTGHAGPAVPLWIVHVGPAGLHAYALVRADAEWGLFTRITATPVAVGASGVEGLAWLAGVVGAHRLHGPVLDNHNRAWTKAHPGYELEVKYTVTGADPWTLATDLHARIGAGEVAGLMLKPGDGLQKWASTNHLFEITGPPPEAGYVSFAPGDGGRTLIKRKWFTEDARLRREHLDVLRLDLPYEQHVRGVLGLTDMIEHPPFHRYRLDVNAEFTDTGNWFSIICDRVQPAGNARQLRQVEIEYCGTRGIFAPDEHAVGEQFDRLTNWVGQILRHHGAHSEPGHYSKLSFLRDLAGTPN